MLREKASARLRREYGSSHPELRQSCGCREAGLRRSFVSDINPRRTEDPMPTFLIEREIPGASKLTDEELRGITQKSNDVVAA